MNVKFAGVAMYLSAVKQGLGHKKNSPFIPWYASTIKCSKVADDKHFDPPCVKCFIALLLRDIDKALSIRPLLLVAQSLTIDT